MVDLETSAVTEEQLNAIMNLFFEDKSGDPIELFKKIFLLGKKRK